MLFRRRPRCSFICWAAALVALVASCAGGGGSTGTGISALTTAQGNVAQSSTASRALPKRTGAGVWLARFLDLVGAPRVARAVGGVEGVHVAIAGTSVADDTDADGAFTLAGDFGGPVTIVFTEPGHPASRFDVDVPTGGTLTLDNVRVDETRGRATPDRQRLDFNGVVARSDCSGGSLAMVSQVTPTDGNTYDVNVGGATLRDSSGNAIACDDLSSGDVLSVQGNINDAGGIDCHDAEREQRGGGNSGPGPGR